MAISLPTTAASCVTACLETPSSGAGALHDQTPKTKTNDGRITDLFHIRHLLPGTLVGTRPPLNHQNPIAPSALIF